MPANRRCSRCSRKGHNRQSCRGRKPKRPARRTWLVPVEYCWADVVRRLPVAKRWGLIDRLAARAS